MKTRPCLSVTDLSPRAISETQTVFMSCQKSQLSKAGRKWDWRSRYRKVNFEAFSCDTYLHSHACAHPRTYVLWDLDEGEGILGGLCWQGPGAEGRGDGSQTSGRHNFSLREDERRTEIRPNIAHFSRQPSWCFIYAITRRHTVAFVFFVLSILSPDTVAGFRKDFDSWEIIWFMILRFWDCKVKLNNNWSACLWWWLSKQTWQRHPSPAATLKEANRDWGTNVWLVQPWYRYIKQTRNKVVESLWWKFTFWFFDITECTSHIKCLCKWRLLSKQNTAHNAGCKFILYPVMCFYFSLIPNQFSNPYVTLKMIVYNCERRTDAIL